MTAHKPFICLICGFIGFLDQVYNFVYLVEIQFSGKGRGAIRADFGPMSEINNVVIKI